MEHRIQSLRTFIGAKSFDESRAFYTAWGFEEVVVSPKMSLFRANGFGFYLQDYHIDDWVNNSMVFMETDNVERYWNELVALNLPSQFPTVKLTPIKEDWWGRECFVHDPSGVLWHIGEFKK